MSRVTLVQIAARRPADGSVELLSWCHNARTRCRFLSVEWQPTLVDLPETELDLGFDGQKFGQGATPEVGQLRVALSRADGLASLAWKGAFGSMRSAPWPAGMADPDDAAFALDMTFRVESIAIMDGLATLTLMDVGQELRRPAVVRKFGATGNALLDGAGAADLKGRVVPTGFGRLRSVPAFLVDRVDNIWLFLDRPAAGVQGFYDGGAAFGAGVPRASLAALKANSPAPGTVDYCLNADGLVLARPWTAPTYPFTADITAAGPLTAAGIAEALVAARTAIPFAAGTVAAFSALQGAPCQLYLDDERTIATALDELIVRLGGWWRLSAGGAIELGRLAPTAPVASFGATQVGSIARQTVVMPTRRRAVGWGRNNRVHSEAEIAAILLTRRRFVYLRAAAQPAAPTGNGLPSGWFDLPPAADGNPLWVSEAEQQGDGLTIGAWSEPRAAEGGAQGPKGDKGDAGADGQTFWEWTAFANSADGVVDFTTGSPDGRAFIGRAVNKPTAAESSSPADYVWAQYKGPPSFGLVARGLAEVASDLIIHRSGSGWGAAGVYSSESYTGACALSVQGVGVRSEAMVGLNSDPALDDSYTSLDYAFYIEAASDILQIYESGSHVMTVAGVFASTAHLAITYDGKAIRYWVNNTLAREVGTAAGRTFWFDSALAAGRCRVVGWGPGGAAGTDGADGLDGADGVSAIVVQLSRPTVTLAADSAGGVAAAELAKAAGQVQVRYKGADVTAAATFAKVAETPGLSGAITAGGAYSLLSIGAIDSGAITLRTTYDPPGSDPAVSIDIDFVVTKAPAGAAAIRAVDRTLSVPSGSMAQISDVLLMPVAAGTVLSLSGSCSYTGTGSSGSTAVRLKASWRVAGSGGAWIDVSAFVQGSFSYWDPVDFAWYGGACSYLISLGGFTVDQLIELRLEGQAIGQPVSVPSFAGTFAVERTA